VYILYKSQIFENIK